MPRSASVRCGNKCAVSAIGGRLPSDIVPDAVDVRVEPLGK